MGTIVKPHAASDGAPARPDHVNAMLDIIYNEFNGNIDWDNLKAALQNAANGLVKLDGDADVPLAQLSKAIPSGIIVMWSGTLATVPTGWSLCDGEGDTPDLRDKFIYGWTDGVDPGAEGGALTHTHTYSDVPSHSHGSAGAHTHSITPNPHRHEVKRWDGTGDTAFREGGNAYSGPDYSENTSLTIGNAVAHTHPAAGVAAPETDAGSSLPPYFKLAFIQKD